MNTLPKPGIVSADRTEAGVVVLFSNGQCAFYPASFLHDAYDRVVPLVTTADVELPWKPERED